MANHCIKFAPFGRPTGKSLRALPSPYAKRYVYTKLRWKVMDKEFARHFAKTAFRSSSMLTELFQMLNQHCDDEALKVRLKDELSKSIADIGFRVIKPVTDKYPEVQAEIDASIEKYGFVIR